MNSLSTVPQLSPSLTASGNSSSVPSPDDDGFAYLPQPPNRKFPLNHFPLPSSRKTSPAASIHALSPSTHSLNDSNDKAETVRARTIAAQEKMFRRFRPYDPRKVAAPLELRFLARSLGLSSHAGLTLEDVEKGRERFISALSTLPDTILKKAYQVKRADRHCIAQRLSLTLSEIESVERRKDYLFSIKEDRTATLAITDAHLGILRELMDNRGLDDLEDDGGFHRAVYGDELIALSIANAQVAQMQETMLSRTGCWSFVHDEPVVPDDEDRSEVDEEEGYSEIGHPPSSDPVSELDGE